MVGGGGGGGATFWVFEFWLAYILEVGMESGVGGGGGGGVLYSEFYSILLKQLQNLQNLFIKL